jgi:glycosyltransferase involved in cell wall biosynthesis
LYTRSLGKGDRVIVVSKILGEYAARFLRIPEEKIRLVYNGVSVDDFFSEKQEEHAIPVIGMISRFTASKGQVLFIEAIHMLIRDRFNINGLIVGSGSPSQRGKIERQIAAKALEKCIAIVSEDSRIALKKIDILVVPSVEPEGFGRTVVEAQMAGVPVVATGIGAIPELIEHGRTGFLVRPRNPADIADAVKWIISNPSETKMIVENARENALSRFTVERMVSGILEVYQEAIALKNS